MGDLAIPEDMSIVPLDEADAKLAEIGDRDAMMEHERLRCEWISISHHTKKGKFEFPLGEELEEFLGVVVYKQVNRKYWAPLEDGSEPPLGTSPTCMSVDLIKPVPSVQEPPNIVCVSCPQNQWGSAKTGSGKGCKEKRTLLVWVQSMRELFFMSLPVTSLGAWTTYTKQIDRHPKVKVFTSVLTHFSLRPRKSKTGYEYQECILTIKGALPTEAAIEFANIGADAAASMEQVVVEEDAPITTEEEGAAF